MPARGETKSVGGKNYQWNGRRWVPARAEPNSQTPQRPTFTSPLLVDDPQLEGYEGIQVGTTAPTPPVAPAPTPSTPTQSSGRGESAPNGSGAQGTRTGPAPMTMDDANKILNRGGLKDKGYTVQNPFTSNQLPATSANPYFDENPAANYNQPLPENMFVQEADLRLTGNVFNAGSGVEYGDILPQLPASGNIELMQQAGAPLTVSSGTFQVTKPNESAQQPEINKIPPRPRGGRQLENWERQYGRMNQTPEREKSELEKGYKPDMERRRAFLDGDLNSMEALRAIEAQKGIVVTGNTYNVVNPNAGQEGENDFKQITKGERDTIMRGGEGAQNLLSSYTSAITESADTPAPRTDYSFDSPDVEDPDKSIKGTMGDLPKNWRNS